MLSNNCSKSLVEHQDDFIPTPPTPWNFLIFLETNKASSKNSNWNLLQLVQSFAQLSSRTSQYSLCFWKYKLWKSMLFLHKINILKYVVHWQSIKSFWCPFHLHFTSYCFDGFSFSLIIIFISWIILEVLPNKPNKNGKTIVQRENHKSVKLHFSESMEYACIRSYLKNYPNFDFSQSNYSKQQYEMIQNDILPKIQCIGPSEVHALYAQHWQAVWQT